MMVAEEYVNVQSRTMFVITTPAFHGAQTALKLFGEIGNTRTLDQGQMIRSVFVPAVLQIAHQLAIVVALKLWSNLAMTKSVHTPALLSHHKNQ
jgi:hypothetical protein